MHWLIFERISSRLFSFSGNIIAFIRTNCLLFALINAIFKISISYFIFIFFLLLIEIIPDMSYINSLISFILQKKRKNYWNIRQQIPPSNNNLLLLPRKENQKYAHIYRCEIFAIVLLKKKKNKFCFAIHFINYQSGFIYI